MRKALETLLQLRDEGVLAKFAIGGAVAASFYIEAVATEDLDVFAFLAPSASGLINLSRLYERCQALGGIVRDEHIVMGGWPVQVLPAYTPLVVAAVSDAQEQVYDGLAVPVVGANFLCAIALQTGRPKDYQRVFSLIEAGKVDALRLRELVELHHLQERWNVYTRRYA